MLNDNKDWNWNWNACQLSRPLFLAPLQPAFFLNLRYKLWLHDSAFYMMQKSIEMRKNIFSILMAFMAKEVKIVHFHVRLWLLSQRCWPWPLTNEECWMENTFEIVEIGNRYLLDTKSGDSRPPSIIFLVGSLPPNTNRNTKSIFIPGRPHLIQIQFQGWFSCCISSSWKRQLLQTQPMISKYKYQIHKYKIQKYKKLNTNTISEMNLLLSLLLVKATIAANPADDLEKCLSSNSVLDDCLKE